MDLKEQRYICTLAQFGSLTHAAEKLYISQPALSLYLSKLEKRLGIPLFDRVGKKLVPTYAGERYIEYAQQMLDLEQRFHAEMADILNEHRGKLRLGVASRRCMYLIPPIIAQFEKAYPQIEVEILSGNLSTIHTLLSEFKIDLVILNAEDTTPEMETHRLFREEFLLAVPIVHPLNEKSTYVPGSKYRQISPKELSGQRLILQTDQQSSRIVQDEILKKYHIRPEHIRVIRNIETGIQMVAEGLGVSFVREGYIPNMHYSKPVNYYTLDMENHASDVIVAHRRGLHLPAYVQSMIDLLREAGDHFLTP